MATESAVRLFAILIFFLFVFAYLGGVYAAVGGIICALYFLTGNVDILLAGLVVVLSAYVYNLVIKGGKK